MATIPFYQVLPLIAIERRVASAMSRNQFIYFEDKQGRTAGYASWIFLEEQEEEFYLKDPVGVTGLSKEKLGTNKVARSSKLWIMDFCGRKSAAGKIATHLRARFANDNPEIKRAKAVRWNSRHLFPYSNKYLVKPEIGKGCRIDSVPVIRKARLHDVYDLASRMRLQDREELRLNSERNPFEALLHNYNNSRVSNTFQLDGRCIGMYGLEDSAKEKNTGIIWLLSSEKLQDHLAHKARVGQKFADEGLQVYNKLVNYICEGTHQDTIKWLKTLGFELTEAIEEDNRGGGKLWKFEKVAS